MIAGLLTERIDLLQPAAAVSPSGEEARGFGLYRTVHAERLRMAGRGSVELGEGFADYSARWRIRSCHRAVAPGWRVREPRPDGLVFNIVAVEPNPRRGCIVLVCERLNP